MGMKKALPRLLVTGLIVQTVVLYLALGRTNQFRYRMNAVQAKLTGQAPHVSWGEVVSVVLPRMLRPSWLREVQCPEAYFRVPVRELQRDDHGHSLWETPLGNFWASSAEGDLLACIVDEELNQRIYDRPPVSVRPGDVVFDGGAHVGVFTRSALGKGARLVIAFEPDPRNLTVLKRTFEKEMREGRLILVEKALWDQAGSIALSLGEHSAATHVEQSDASGERVPTTTIDDAVREHGLARVDFIKLDIEGSETHAIEGASSTLSSFAPRMVICIYHKPEDPVTVTHAVMRRQLAYSVDATPTQAYFHRAATEP